MTVCSVPAHAAEPRRLDRQQVTCQLIQGETINIALELDHGVHLDPVINPAPSIKLGMPRGAQTDITIASYQSQQKPNLLLPLITAAPFALHPVLRHLITHPFSRA